MMEFENIEYLIALVALPLLVLWFWRAVVQRKKNLQKIGDPQIVSSLLKGFSAANYRNKFLLLLAAVGMIVLSSANLREPSNNDQVKRSGLDVMIALDVSKSMLANDVAPNRLEKAKQLISKLITKLEGNRIGIVLFAGRAYLQMPLTNDVYAARMYVSTANPDVVGTQGTVIGEALKLCNQNLDTKERKYKSVLLITDGEDHDEEALKNAKELAKNGMIVNTIGIGSVNGSTITDPQSGETKKDANGQPVVSKLNEKILVDIASSTGGIYQNLSDVQSTVDVILKQLDGMEKKTIVGNSWVNYKTFFFWFAAAALFFLVLEIFLPDRKKQNA